jgi:hypothetical protein
MVNWETGELGKFVQIINGGAWNASEYVEEGIAVVRVSDIRDGTVFLDDCKYLPKGSLEKYKKHLLFEGDLVVTTVGSHPTQPGSVVGRAAIIPKHAHGTLLNQNAVRIVTCHPRLEQSFLGYFGKSQFFRDYIISRARGAANQVRMAISELSKMPIFIPPVSTQRKIANILSAYDNLIENNIRRIQIMEGLAHTIYQEWFIFYHFPGHEAIGLVETEEGFISNGWDYRSVLDIPEFNFITNNIEPYSGKKVYFATANIEGNELTKDGISVSFFEKPSRAQKMPVVNSVWFARMKDTHKVLCFTQANAQIAKNSILSSGMAGFKTLEKYLAT